MSDYLEIASKELNIPIEKLRDPDGLSPADEWVFNDWRAVYNLRCRMPSNAEIAEGTGISLERVNAFGDLPEKDQWRIRAFIAWRLSSTPFEEAMAIADRQGLDPHIVQSVLNLRKVRSKIVETGKGWDIPSDLDSMSSLRCASSSRHLPLDKLYRCLKKAQEILDPVITRDDWPDPPPLLGQLLSVADAQEKGRLYHAASSLKYLLNIVDIARKQQSRPGHPSTPDWVVKAASLFQNHDLTKGQFTSLMLELGVSRGMNVAWNLAKAK